MSSLTPNYPNTVYLGSSVKRWTSSWVDVYNLLTFLSKLDIKSARNSQTGMSGQVWLRSGNVACGMYSGATIHTSRK